MTDLLSNKVTSELRRRQEWHKPKEGSMICLKKAPNGHIGYFDADIRGSNFHSYLSVIKNIPSRLWDKNQKTWHIGIQDYEILRNDLAKKNLTQIDIEEDLKVLLAQYKKWELDTIEFAEKEDCELSIDPKILKMKLMPHQKVALEFMLRRKIGLNASEMGTGKTFPSVVLGKHLYDTGMIKDCLVVCIASVKWNWAKEIDKCVHDANYVVIEGTPMERAEKYMSKALFKIVNYEILRNDIDTILYDREFDCIIVDEIHRIRTYKAKQTKALYTLGKKAKYRFGLTGTPIQNKLTDLFSIMRFIHPKYLGDWFPFDRRYMIKGYFGDTVDYKNLEEVHRKLKTIMIRRLKNEVLKDLPPKVYNDIFLELGAKQRKFYKDVSNNILKSDDEDVEEKIKQANVLANITYLREICDSTELIDPEVIQSEKMKELKKLVPELVENGHKIVIFSQFKRMVRIIKRDLKFPAITLTGDDSTEKGVRERLIENFNQSKDKNVFIMTTAGGEGINLQVADYIIFFDLPFNPQVIAQVEDRLHRKGQTETVNVIKLIAKNTIEERVLEILKFKTDLFKQVVDGISGEAIKVTQKEILDAIRQMDW